MDKEKVTQFISVLEEVAFFADFCTKLWISGKLKRNRWYQM